MQGVLIEGGVFCFMVGVVTFSMINLTHDSSNCLRVSESLFIKKGKAAHVQSYLD